MKNLSTSRALMGLGLIITISCVGLTASAQSMELDYQCSCSKKPKAKTNPCLAKSTPTVTVKSSVKGKDEFREKAASNLCHKVYKSSCPPHSCEAQVTKLGERVLDKGAQKHRKDAQKSGMSDKHVEALAKYAKDKGLTIIVRSSNQKSVQYQSEDKTKYRPKPLAINALNTEHRGQYAGLIREPSLKKILDNPNIDKKDADVAKEIEALRNLKKKCKKDKDGDGVEDDENSKSPPQPCDWYFDNNGLIRDSKKRAVYGDYDLQGVYEGSKLLQTNAHTKEGKDRLRELNKALDPERSTKWGVSGKHKIPIQWMIQHGANDNYRKSDGTVGRCTPKDEDFIIFQPDGSTVYIAQRSHLKKYYEQHKMKWLYKQCP